MPVYFGAAGAFCCSSFLRSSSAFFCRSSRMPAVCERMSPVGLHVGVEPAADVEGVAGPDGLGEWQVGVAGVLAGGERDVLEGLGRGWRGAHCPQNKDEGCRRKTASHPHHFPLTFHGIGTFMPTTSSDVVAAGTEARRLTSAVSRLMTSRRGPPPH